MLAIHRYVVITAALASRAVLTSAEEGTAPEVSVEATPSPKPAVQTSAAQASAQATPSPRPAEQSSAAEQSPAAELQAKVSALEDSNAELKSKAEELQAKVNTLESEKSSMAIDMQGKVDSLGTERDTQKAEAEKLKNDLNSRDQILSDLRTELDTEKNSVKSKEDKINELTEKIKTLESTVDLKASEISQLTEDKKTQEAEITRLREDGASQTEKLQAEKGESSRLEKEVASQKSLAQNLNTIWDETKKKLKKRERELEDIKAKYADPSVQHFLQAKAVKVYRSPGIEGAANKTYKFVLPTLRERYGRGKELFHESEKIVYSKLNAYVGSEKTEPWLPAISGYLVYGTVVVPFLCTVFCLTRIVCKMRLLLLFCHVDFLLTTLSAMVFAFWTGREPLLDFAHHDAAVYLFTQVFYAVILCLYAILLCLSLSCSKSGTRERCYRCTQIIVAMPIAYIYYRHVWTPAMLDEMPHMDQVVSSVIGEGAAVSTYTWLPYCPALLQFLLLLYLERLSWHAAGAANAAKAQEQISITIRDASLTSIMATEDASTYGKKH
mmetsp:Transcript_64804/g.118270  ORF Transcript_64804/g.118270 Transcript_64804/m.118270 type:complete len:554 (+) Transcript_64804:59-1720(+)